MNLAKKNAIYNADVRYLPLSEMGHMAMLHLNQGRFSLLKSLFEISLNQMTMMNSLVFYLTGSTTVTSALAISEERSNLQ